MCAYIIYARAAVVKLKPSPRGLLKLRLYAQKR